MGEAVGVPANARFTSWDRAGVDKEALGVPFGADEAIGTGLAC